MTAKQWNDIYRREKADDLEAAIRTLLDGLVRETENRIRRVKPTTTSETGKILQEVNAIWEEVARNNPEMKTGAWRQVMEERSELFAKAFNAV